MHKKVFVATFCLIFLLVGSTLALAQNPVTVTRSISSQEVGPNDTFTVTVTIEINEDFAGMALNEKLNGMPDDWGNWTVTPVEKAGATFKDNSIEWVWLSASAGDTKTVEYEVTVPDTQESFGEYEINGIVKSKDSETPFEVGVEGPERVTVPAVKVTRKVESPQVVPGGSTNVSVTVEALTDIDGLVLDEDLNGMTGDWGSWDVGPVQTSEATFKSSTIEWLWMGLAEGATETIEYRVDVPTSALSEGEKEKNYPLSGKVSSQSPVFQQIVKPEGGEKKNNRIKVVNYLSIPYVVSHWNIETEQVDHDLPCEISTDQILTAIAWWADEEPVPRTGDKTMSTDMILKLIANWSDGVCIDDPAPVNEESTVATEEEKRSQSSLVNVSRTIKEDGESSTNPATFTLEVKAERDIAGLLVNYDLPKGWEVTPTEKDGSEFKESEDQFLWLELQKGEENNLTYKVKPSSDAKVGETYEIKASLKSGSPGFTRKLSNKSVTVVEPVEFSLNGVLASPNPVMGRGEVVFVAEGTGVRSVKVDLYSSAGEQVFEGNWKDGNSVKLNLAGKGIANGIYLYQFSAKGMEDVEQTDIKKLIVLQ